ncbi:MAG: GGDEF domain-containing protein [Nanoarchaeota archaeon]|nr:GGDEF domain-containing protein [Nanoarchaeota archaeon]MBU1027809.1 GGDEF domain-containing protein [Nanoarchaeota archaeon]
MEEYLKKRLKSVDYKTRRKIEKLFKEMNESISLLFDIATRDEKTGLYNDKFFNTELEMEIEKAQRGKQKLSLVITDIDYFKKINDKYGHIKADELLYKLAKVIQKQIRKSDIAARFGGEEFVILLPETSLTKAKKLCIRLRNAIHKDKVLKKHGLTVSGGITQFRKKDNKKAFKSRSDKALYQAKKQGRDEFVVLG